MAEEKMENKSASISDVMGGKKSEKKEKSDKPESKSSKSSGKKTKHRHTHIEHHDDGSHTVRHTPVGGGDEVSYAAPDMDAVHDGLEEHVGTPNDGEGEGAPEAPAAAGGAASAQAAPAGAQPQGM